MVTAPGRGHHAVCSRPPSRHRRTPEDTTLELFTSWNSLGGVLLNGVMAYVGLLVFLRISGKRTLAKLNAFDLVVTVALGSTLATVLLPNNPAISDGVVALAFLVGAQFSVAWLQVRWTGFRRLVKSDPSLLFYRGRWLEERLVEQRVARDELFAAIRSSGVADLDSIEAVVLETDGSISVVSRPERPASRSSLSDVSGIG